MQAGAKFEQSLADLLIRFMVYGLWFMGFRGYRV